VLGELDNPNRSEIRRFAKVIWLKNRNVDAKFAETQFYEKDIGFYMRKKFLPGQGLFDNLKKGFVHPETNIKLHLLHLLLIQGSLLFDK
jgi:hypothetical protein